MKIVYPGFMLVELLKNSGDYASVQDINEAGERIRRRFPDVTPILDRYQIASIYENFPECYERVETPVPGQTIGKLGFRRTAKPFSRNYFEIQFQRPNSHGLEGTFSNEEIQGMRDAVNSR